MTFRGDAQIIKRHWVEILNGAMKHAIERWHWQFLPRHFTHAGATMYGYQRRRPVKQGKRTIPAESYKYRRKGHSYPLVWSGRMKAAVMAGIDVRAQKTKPVVKGHMQGPNYLRPAGRPALMKGAGLGPARRSGWRVGGHTLPDMGAELTATTPQEREYLLDVVRMWVLDVLRNKLRETRTVTTGPSVVSSVRVA